MGKLTRRVFVGTGAAVVVGAGASLVTCNIRASETAALADFAPLDVLLTRLVDPTRIGRFYRQAAFSLDDLADQAYARPHIVEALSVSCPTSRYDVLRQGVRAEFAARDIVVCDRFVLSRTECITAGLRFDQLA